MSKNNFIITTAHFLHTRGKSLISIERKIGPSIKPQGTQLCELD